MSEAAATETPAEGAPPAKGGGRKTVILAGLVGLLSAAAGFAVPQFLGGGAAPVAAEPTHSAAAPAGEHEGEAGQACVPFGDVVANLDDHRMMRYVRAKFSLAVDRKDIEPVQHVVEQNRTSLKNWLIGYLQNKQIDEVRGTEGFNRIRREIQDRFNELLFPEGPARIREVLFEEFNIQ